jgi:hypothetical protein
MGKDQFLPTTLEMVRERQLSDPSSVTLHPMSQEAEWGKRLGSLGFSALRNEHGERSRGTHHAPRTTERARPAEM